MRGEDDKPPTGDEGPPGHRQDVSEDDPTWVSDDAPSGPTEEETSVDLRPDETCTSSEMDETVVSAEDLPGSTPRPSSGRPPASIGAYQILSELGRGGMGTVYLAVDPNLARRIALKLLPPKLSSHPRAFARFRDEARLLASMSHPNIATIHSLEEDTGRHFLTMELVAGHTLGDRLREGALPVGEWFLVARQIATALAAAHNRGIVHLDLKPGNVMLTDEGQVKVLDFGLAMALGTREEEGGARTQARRQEAISGTPGYMAPEQAQGREVDSRADVWALGCVLYECATGQKAFDGNNTAERIRASVTREPELSLIPAEYPEGVIPILRGALAKDVTRRTATVDEILTALEDALHVRVPVRKETPNNLPSQLSSFVGRTRQKAEILGRIGGERLLTLTGVGGGGKTRLALEVARASLDRFADGVWFIELAPLTDPGQLPSRLLRVLGGREEPGRDVLSILVELLRTRTTLLVLDDCETHLDAAARLAEELLSACGGLSVLATSREALGLSGESIYQLPSLAVPQGERVPPMAELLEFEAIQLFEARARSVRPDFGIVPENAAAVHQICQRLDGIPLAIELAAARVRVLSPEAIAERLDDRFRLLTSSKRGGDPRHQTLRALIDWSYDHLDPGEQSTLDRLSIFAGGWELEACERICVGEDVEEWEILDHISNLVDKSLVEVDTAASERTGRTRYRLLQTIRAYARERLEARGGEVELRRRHRDHFLGLAERGVPELTGKEQALWLRLLAADHHNFRVALAALPGGNDLDRRLELGGTLGRYWAIRGHWSEGRSTLEDLLEGEVPRTRAAALALNWAGNFAKLQGDVPAAQNLLERSLEIRREIGDEPGVASSLHNLGNVVKDGGDRARARELYEESRSIYEKLNDENGIAITSGALGMIAVMEGDLVTAGARFGESLALREKLQDRHEMAFCLNNLGWVAEAQGDLEAAAERQRAALDIHRELGQRLGVAASLTNLANLANKMDDLPSAQASYEEALTLVRELGDRRGEATILNNLGDLDLMRGDLDRSEQHYRESLGILASLRDRTTLPHLVRALGGVADRRGDDKRAACLLAAAEGLRESVGTNWTPETQTQNDHWINGLRDRLGEGALSDATVRGRALTPEQSVAFALGQDPVEG